MSASGGASEAPTVTVIGAPAAGADFSFVIPNVMEILMVNGTLVTSAVVASRVPRLRFTDNAAHILGDSPAQSVQAASSTNRFTWFQGGGLAGLGGDESMPIPIGMYLQPGWILSCSTANIDVGDQWSAFVLTAINR